MEYNEIIARITGQDEIRHRILYSMQNEANGIFKIIGEKGTGKRTLCENIANSWTSQKQGKVFYLNSAYQEMPEDYSTFKNFIYQNSNGKELLNVFQEALKDMPLWGNTLSAIYAEVLKIIEKREQLDGDFSQNEQYILHFIGELSKNSNILILCFDYELWDLKSQQVLLHLIDFTKNTLHANKSFFIFSSAKDDEGEAKSAVKKEKLKKIAEEEIGEVAKQFNSSFNLTNDQKKQIHDLTNGNLELIKESLNVFTSTSIPLSYNFYDIIKTQIERSSSEVEGILQLLKQTAFIGEKVDTRLLEIFLEKGPELYEQLLGEAISLCYLQEDEYTISFVKRYIYTIIKDCLLKDRKYYIRLSKCINLLYPSRYDLQMHYLYRGGLRQQADIMFFIYLIGYYRENNIAYNLSGTDKELLSQNQLFSTYEKICYCYQLYKNKKYDEAEENLRNLYCETIEFRFEKDYLLSLVVTNKYYTTEEFLERIDVLTTYDTENFNDQYPEMYLRALMMLAEFYAETVNENALRDCLKKINKCFSQYATTDKQMQCYEHCFKLKANAFYKIEVAVKYNKDAFEYFGKPENKQIYLSKYYLSILNYSANLIVTGEYEDSYHLLQEALCIIQESPYLKSIHEDILMNNLAISGYYSHIYSEIECAKVLDDILKKITEAADNFLVQNNKVAFLTLAGQYEEALKISELLYERIQYTGDVDNYYRYFISNNYGILLWLSGKKEDAFDVLKDAFTTVPLLKDAAYFKTRSDKILSLLSNSSLPENINLSEWNISLYKQKANILGSAWKFWSSLILFSELQIWSDF